MFRISINEYTLAVSDDYPNIYNEYHKRARLVEILGSYEAEGAVCFVSLSKDSDWPFLVVVQKYSPEPESGFDPGVMFIPETHFVFIGAGKRLLAYTWDPPEKVWEEHVMGGFWGWRRYQQFVIMSSEIELAVWDIHGRKYWSSHVEPPWYYTVDGDTMNLDVMGKKTSFSLQHGPVR